LVDSAASVSAYAADVLVSDDSLKRGVSFTVARTSEKRRGRRLARKGMRQRTCVVLRKEIYSVGE
jgi:hypothetical protein